MSVHIAEAIKLQYFTDNLALGSYIRKALEEDIRDAKLLGVIYLADNCPEVRFIERLGFAFIRNGDYYVLPYRLNSRLRKKYEENH